jgi:hypothetical protein
MLHACVLSYGTKWEDCLPFAEFSYNNSYQASLQMAPFEALYGCKCRTPLNWSETGESQVFRLDIIKEAEEQVQLIRNYLKVELCRFQAKDDDFQRGRFFLPLRHTTQGYATFPFQGQACTPIYWPIQDPRASWRDVLQA